MIIFQALLTTDPTHLHCRSTNCRYNCRCPKPPTIDMRLRCRTRSRDDSNSLSENHSINISAYGVTVYTNLKFMMLPIRKNMYYRVGT